MMKKQNLLPLTLALIIGATSQARMRPSSELGTRLFGRQIAMKPTFRSGNLFDQQPKRGYADTTSKKGYLERLQQKLLWKQLPPSPGWLAPASLLRARLKQHGYEDFDRKYNISNKLANAPLDNSESILSTINDAIAERAEYLMRSGKLSSHRDRMAFQSEALRARSEIISILLSGQHEDIHSKFYEKLSTISLRLIPQFWNDITLP